MIFVDTWAWVALDPTGCPDGWARSLLIRRDPDPDSGDAEYAYFLCYHRQGTTLSELIGVAGRRWGIEESFAIAKSEAGLDEHQVRRWTAWYRHAILSTLAAAFLAVTRARVPANPTAWQAGLSRTPATRSAGCWQRPFSASTGASGSPCDGRPGDAATKPTRNCRTTGAAASCSTTPAIERSSAPQRKIN